ncbi:MAG TPA: iron ABC transporter permease [Stellaceae bacterium]|nr:iron ABC transporter permease [Stellaceae bacterium]
MRRRAPFAARFSETGWIGTAILALAAIIALYLVIAPLGMLFAAAFRGPQDALPFEPGTQWTLANLAAVYAERRLYTTVIPNTLIFVAGSVTLGFAAAFVLAWLVERTDLRARGAVYAAVLFPLLVPGVVLGIAWTFLLGPHAGWINVALRALLGLAGDGPLDIFSMAGLILAQGAALVPFLFLLLGAALRTMNPALEEASSTAGAPPWATFLRVTLPVLRPGILAPLILASLIALEQFEMPLVIGLPARIDIFSTRIYYELNPDTNLPAFGRAAAVALPFLAAAMLLLLAYNRAVRRAERFAIVAGKAYRPARLALGRWAAPAWAFIALYLGFAVVLPALVLLWTSLYGFAVPSLALLPRASFQAYATLFARADFFAALRNTFIVAGASAAIVTSLGALIAWTVLRSRLPGRALLDVLSIISIGIPAVIAGLAVMLLYLSLPIGLYGTVWVLVLAYSYRLAVATRLSRASLTQLHREHEEASYVAGGQWLATMGRVVLPLLRPTLTANFVLLFVIGVREFTLPTILASRDNPVLSVTMWNLFIANESGSAAAVGCLLVACVAPVVVIARRLLPDT